MLSIDVQVGVFVREFRALSEGGAAPDRSLQRCQNGILAFGALALRAILHMTTKRRLAAGSELRDRLLPGIAYILGIQ